VDWKTLPRAWKVIVAGLGLEILIAVAAILVKATGSCESCGPTSLADVAIGAAGAVFYAILLGVALWLGPTLLLFVGIIAGFAVHAALLFLMISSGTLCPPCVLAGGVSAILFAAAMVYDTANLRRAAIVLPLVAILLQAGSLITRHLRDSAIAEARAEAIPDQRSFDGRVRLVIFEEPDCPYCKILEQEVLPAIEREFGPNLEILRRRGSDFPGIALPTVIVVGTGEEVFEGLPTRELLRDAIVRALERVQTNP
jgi:hypothetical protein